MTTSAPRADFAAAAATDSSNVGVGLRAVAAIVDSVILFALGYGLALFTGGTTSGGFELSGGPFFVWLVVAIAYYVVLEARSGDTLGKKLVGLQVVKLDGIPITMRESVVRNVLRLVDGLFFYLVGAIVVWASKKNQRLGDRLAGTVVRRRPSVKPATGVA